MLGTRTHSTSAFPVNSGGQEHTLRCSRLEHRALMPHASGRLQGFLHKLRWQISVFLQFKSIKHGAETKKGKFMSQMLHNKNSYCVCLTLLGWLARERFTFPISRAIGVIGAFLLSASDFLIVAIAKEITGTNALHFVLNAATLCVFAAYVWHAANFYARLRA